MEDATVQLILNRVDKIGDDVNAKIDKLESKLDKAIATQTDHEVRLAKAEMVLEDTKFKSRVLYASHALAVAIGGVFITILHYFFPGVKIPTR